MPARVTPRVRRPLAAAALALAALAMTGCQDGTGLRDEGPAKSHAPHLDQPAARHTQRPSGREHRPDGPEKRG
ncbi:hypothetical protein ABZT17_41795 [Streptomyces sp. NPDC005648]|uniref:hypothetical protein n=1 Tax=Streptomyces sp. NPDC005648 TaxID=3157044 RepID=UPI0033B205EF